MDMVCFDKEYRGTPYNYGVSPEALHFTWSCQISGLQSSVPSYTHTSLTVIVQASCGESIT